MRSVITMLVISGPNHFFTIQATVRKGGKRLYGTLNDLFSSVDITIGGMNTDVGAVIVV